MTLMQRDRENIELGREEGFKMALDIIRLHLDGKNRSGNCSHTLSENGLCPAVPGGL